MSWITVPSGARVYPLEPNPADFTLHDVVQCLDRKCRWGGGTDRHYSVAEHSVYVAQATAQRLEYLGAESDVVWIGFASGLLHDVGETFLPDVSRPIKDALWYRMPNGDLVSHHVLEERHIVAAFQQARLPWPLNPMIAEAVKWADDAVLHLEARDIVPGATWWESRDPPPAPIRLTLYSPDLFRRLLVEYTQLR